MTPMPPASSPTAGAPAAAPSDFGPPHQKRPWALFFDVDGTLVEQTEPPEAAAVSPRLRPILHDLIDATGGAVALVSGRAISSLDRLFAPLVLPAAGQHGMERRTGRGDVIQPPVDRTVLAHLIAAVRDFAATRPGLRVEVKTLSVGLDYRAAPAQAEAAEHFFQNLVDRDGPGFRVQRGRRICEVRSVQASKGVAVEAFMTEPPFAGRVPVYLGDDLPDEDAFVATNRLGGMSIRVGGGDVATAARWRIGHVAQVHRWLADLAVTMRADAAPPRRAD